MDVGFTGTQQGMTDAQRATLRTWLVEHYPDSLHHGDCIGADAQAHALALEWGIPVTLHPPEDGSKRAFCVGAVNVAGLKPYLERNHDIVDYTGVLIATPKGYSEERRSGTWATVRYARKMGRRVIIIHPDGTLK